MKKEVLYDALNLLDDDLVYEVEELRRKYEAEHIGQSKRSGLQKKWGHAGRWVSLAACACVAVVVISVVSQSGILQMDKKKESALETEMVKKESAVMPSSKGAQENIREEKLEETKEDVKGDGLEKEEDAMKEETARKGIVIPKMEVDLNKNTSATMDMLAFFIWQGRSYVQYEYELVDVDLAGEYVGTAVGLIDEWTKKDGYVDYAGSISGDFYTVKGYDPSFMLCMKRENGMISTFINDNDMILYTGADLFEERFHLTGNYEAVQYQTRDDWQRSTGVICQVAEPDLEVVERFVDAVNKAPFMLTEDVPLEEGERNLYDREIYHMFFEMKNGMTVHIRLYEGGYVRFHGLIWACVKVEEEVFEEMIAVMEP